MDIDACLRSLQTKSQKTASLHQVKSVAFQVLTDLHSSAYCQGALSQLFFLLGNERRFKPSVRITLIEYLLEQTSKIEEYTLQCAALRRLQASLIEFPGLFKEKISIGAELAYLYQQHGDSKKAEKEYRKVIRVVKGHPYLQPRCVGLFLNYSELLSQEKCHRMALDFALRAVEQAEENLLLICKDKERVEQLVLAYYRTALEFKALKDTKNSNLWLNKAVEAIQTFSMQERCGQVLEECTHLLTKLSNTTWRPVKTQEFSSFVSRRRQSKPLSTLNHHETPFFTDLKSIDKFHREMQTLYKPKPRTNSSARRNSFRTNIQTSSRMRLSTRHSASSRRVIPQSSGSNETIQILTEKVRGLTVQVFLTETGELLIADHEKNYQPLVLHRNKHLTLEDDIRMRILPHLCVEAGGIKVAAPLHSTKAAISGQEMTVEVYDNMGGFNVVVYSSATPAYFTETQCPIEQICGNLAIEAGKLVCIQQEEKCYSEQEEQYIETKFLEENSEITEVVNLEIKEKSEDFINVSPQHEVEESVQHESRDTNEKASSQEEAEAKDFPETLEKVNAVDERDGFIEVEATPEGSEEKEPLIIEETEEVEGNEFPKIDGTQEEVNTVDERDEEFIEVEATPEASEEEKSLIIEEIEEDASPQSPVIAPSPLPIDLAKSLPPKLSSPRRYITSSISPILDVQYPSALPKTYELAKNMVRRGFLKLSSPESRQVLEVCEYAIDERLYFMELISKKGRLYLECTDSPTQHFFWTQVHSGYSLKQILSAVTITEEAIKVNYSKIQPLTVENPEEQPIEFTKFTKTVNGVPYSVFVTLYDTAILSIEVNDDGRQKAVLEVKFEQVKEATGLEWLPGPILSIYIAAHLLDFHTLTISLPLKRVDMQKFAAKIQRFVRRVLQKKERLTGTVKINESVYCIDIPCDSSKITLKSQDQGTFTFPLDKSKDKPLMKILRGLQVFQGRLWLVEGIGESQAKFYTTWECDAHSYSLSIVLGPPMCVITAMDSETGHQLSLTLYDSLPEPSIEAISELTNSLSIEVFGNHPVLVI